jgi:hypothetical protein
MNIRNRGTRDHCEKEELRAQIWDLFLGNQERPGLMQYEIARKLGKTQQTISYHIQKTLTEFKHANAAKAEQYTLRELSLVALGESKAWKHERMAYLAWRRSDKKNCRFLQEARAAREEVIKWHERRCKLLGIESPQKLDLGKELVIKVVYGDTSERNSDQDFGLREAPETESVH